MGQKGGAYVEDLTSVFIRGVSAAIVVFLAVYGGLAVFAAGEADPNPYAVLFAVLVAAVFSDDAWNWARSKFAAQMANRDQSGDQTRKPEGEPNAAKKEVQAAQTPPA